LGITGASLKKDIDDGFNVKKITSYVDFIHVLTFDLHGPWDSQVDYAAPLDWQIESLKYWWEKGAEKHKLLMSIPLFARTWTLSNLKTICAKQALQVRELLDLILRQPVVSVIMSYAQP